MGLTSSKPKTDPNPISLGGGGGVDPRALLHTDSTDGDGSSDAGHSRDARRFTRGGRRERGGLSRHLWVEDTGDLELGVIGRSTSTTRHNADGVETPDSESDASDYEGDDDDSLPCEELFKKLDNILNKAIKISIFCAMVGQGGFAMLFVDNILHNNGYLEDPSLRGMLAFAIFSSVVWGKYGVLEFYSPKDVLQNTARSIRRFWRNPTKHMRAITLRKIVKSAYTIYSVLAIASCFSGLTKEAFENEKYPLQGIAGLLLALGNLEFLASMFQNRPFQGIFMGSSLFSNILMFSNVINGYFGAFPTMSRGLDVFVETREFRNKKADATKDVRQVLDVVRQMAEHHDDGQYNFVNCLPAHRRREASSQGVGVGRTHSDQDNFTQAFYQLCTTLGIPSADALNDEAFGAALGRLNYETVRQYMYPASTDASMGYPYAYSDSGSLGSMNPAAGAGAAGVGMTTRYTTPLEGLPAVPHTSRHAVDDINEEASTRSRQRKKQPVCCAGNDNYRAHFHTMSTFEFVTSRVVAFLAVTVIGWWGLSNFFEQSGEALPYNEEVYGKGFAPIAWFLRLPTVWMDDPQIDGTWLLGKGFKGELFQWAALANMSLMGVAIIWYSALTVTHVAFGLGRALTNWQNWFALLSNPFLFIGNLPHYAAQSCHKLATYCTRETADDESDDSRTGRDESDEREETQRLSCPYRPFQISWYQRPVRILGTSAYWFLGVTVLLGLVLGGLANGMQEFLAELSTGASDAGAQSGLADAAASAAASATASAPDLEDQLHTSAAIASSALIELPTFILLIAGPLTFGITLSCCGLLKTPKVLYRGPLTDLKNPEENRAAQKHIEALRKLKALSSHLQMMGNGLHPGVDLNSHAAQECYKDDRRATRFNPMGSLFERRSGVTALRGKRPHHACSSSKSACQAAAGMVFG